jgi:uncharacterized membrane protein YphA (DoxX/SURF4 family)
LAYLIFALRLVLGGVLLVAGVLKAHDGPASTAVTIAGYRILPSAVVAPLGVALPYFEIFVGAYLIGGLFTRIAGWIAAVQFSIFSAAVASLVIRHIAADCGCFGSGVPVPPSWGHVAIDVLAACASIVVAVRGPGAFALDWLLFPSSYFRSGREAHSP